MPGSCLAVPCGLIQTGSPRLRFAPHRPRRSGLPKPQDAQTPFELLRDKNLRDQVSELLEVLDDRERKIIFQRFGLDGGKPKTLEEVGKKFGVTRERIRQLQNIALAKLRRALSKKEKPIEIPQEIFEFN